MNVDIVYYRAMIVCSYDLSMNVDIVYYRAMIGMVI